MFVAVTATTIWPSFLFPLPGSVQFIVVFVVKVLKLKEVNDVREYEDEDSNKAAAGLLKPPQAENNDDGAGHHVSAQGWAAPTDPVICLIRLRNLS